MQAFDASIKGRYDVGVEAFDCGWKCWKWSLCWYLGKCLPLGTLGSGLPLAGVRALIQSYLLE